MAALHSGDQIRGPGDCSFQIRRCLFLDGFSFGSCRDRGSEGALRISKRDAVVSFSQYIVDGCDHLGLRIDAQLLVLHRDGIAETDTLQRSDLFVLLRLP